MWIMMATVFFTCALFRRQWMSTVCAWSLELPVFMDRLHAQFFELVFKMVPNACTHDCLTCFYVIAHQFEKKIILIDVGHGAMSPFKLFTTHHHVHLFHTQHEQGTPKACACMREISIQAISLWHMHTWCAHWSVTMLQHELGCLATGGVKCLLLCQLSCTAYNLSLVCHQLLVAAWSGLAECSSPSSIPD